ncbi:NADH oxidase [Thermoplasmatales archaeon SW_10_69_26]|jgi:NAD(P)H-nitrite reductase large subunit|nr:MAG: NADH oxidase [Thermoplasmatales archaeon SW_10_69_26]
MGREYVIIGDGIAGATAAEEIRENDPSGEITIVTDEPVPLYNRVATKDLAKGDKDREDLMMHDREFYEKHDIDLRTNTRVTEIRDAERRVVCHDGSRYSFDKLLVASGGTPRRLPVPNSDAEGIHTFWTLDDADRLKKVAKDADDAVVIGAGLLGIDQAVIFGKHGANTRYLMRGNRWWRQGISKEGSEVVEKGLAEFGVECIFHEEVEQFDTQEGRVTECVGSSGKTYPCDAAGVAIGLHYNHEFLRGSRVKIGEGILTDEYMRTSVEDIYAAGDIAQYYDVVLDRVNQNGSWASAKEQGAVAGRNMTKDEDEDLEEFELVDTYSINHFDFFIMSVGSVLGDKKIDRVYDDGNYRRVIFFRDRPVGAVFVGDVTQAGIIRKIIGQKKDFSGREELLLEEEVDPTLLQ